jgi:DNA-binding NarL/FixJ family response regulator
MPAAKKKIAEPVAAPAPTGSARIMIVDDHPIVRRGLVQLIQQEPGFKVVKEVESSSEAMRSLREELPDLVIVDLSLRDINGIELIKQVKAVWPQLPMMVLSMHDEGLYAERAIRAGALGYIMKQEGTEKLITAMKSVLKGEVYLSEAMARRVLGRMVAGQPSTSGSPMDDLSDRELEVFELLGRGASTRQIAERLSLSIKTVESHREHIKRKLHLKNASELVQHATEWVLRATRAAGEA